MLHIVVDPAQMKGDLLYVTGKDVNHIKNVMRLKKGDEISVRTGQDDREYRYGIEEFTDSEVVCRLRFVKEADVELPVKVYIFQGLPKADKMELIIQKAVELGAAEIIPVEMRRSVVKLDASKKAKKTQRWQAIAESAAKQSRRAVVPMVREPMTMEEAVRFAEQNTDVRLLPYELQEADGSTRDVMDGIREGSAVSIFIGPEGGFDPAEVELAREAGIRPISLGKRILRTETAALVALSFLIYHFEI
ncbi:MAG: 16S rRNA (uracil(1498)-N(3))-methyltransferase [Lachnospiraceae bacterium]|nr:16S rRNA (uracil(1498)-N(3))-methyltransferase [Lachnospiraceae bacterium]